MTGDFGWARRDADVDVRQWIFPMNAKVDAILPDGTHRYWSTHCRHATSLDDPHHAKCSAKVGLDRDGEPFARRPARCQRCASPCICPCHGAPGG